VNPLYVVAIISAVAALAGVAVNNAITTRNDRLRWEREEGVRYHDKRVEAYVQFARDVGRFAAFGHMDTNRFDYNPDMPMNKEQTTLYLDASAAYQRVWMLGTPGVVMAAEGVWRIAMDAATIKGTSAPVMPKMMAAFYDAARLELGIIDTSLR